MTASNLPAVSFVNCKKAYLVNNLYPDRGESMRRSNVRAQRLAKLSEQNVARKQKADESSQLATKFCASAQQGSSRVCIFQAAYLPHER